MNKQDRQLFIISIWTLLGLTFLWFVGLYILRATGMEELLECSMKRYFGIPCPGCGGTRAVKELLAGHIIKSIYYHPVVLYTAIVYGVFFISHMLSLATKGHTKGMHFRMAYVWIAVAIIVVQYIIKLSIPGVLGV